MPEQIPMGLKVTDALNDNMSLAEIAERIHGKIPPCIQAVINTCQEHGWSTDPFLLPQMPEVAERLFGNRSHFLDSFERAVILPHQQTSAANRYYMPTSGASLQ